jgi:hypothetical protein
VRSFRQFCSGIQKHRPHYTGGPGVIQGGGKGLGMDYPVLVNPGKPS